MSDLRKAAEMALEFVEWFCGDDHSVKPKNSALETREALRTALAQPEQEPFIVDRGCWERGCMAYDWRDGDGVKVTKREWVGLTDEEGAEIWGDAHDIDWKRLVTPKEIIKRIEAKLKEKNGG